MRILTSIAASLAIMTLFAPHAACKKSGGTKAAQGASAPTVQQPAVAGQFYPAEPAALRRIVDEDLAKAPAKQLDGALIGLVAPHAGYPYSGPIAAAAFRQLEGRHYARVVVMGISHRVPYEGAALATRDLYRTPLGDIPIDTASVQALLRKYAWAHDDPRPYAVEHSLEVELPFLQATLKDFTLVPILIGEAGKETLDEIAAALDEQFPGDDTLFVASSDLSHYHPYADAQERDRRTVGFICEKGAQDYRKAVASGAAELCGAAPVYVMKRIAERRTATLELLQYANSGDTAGDTSRVVGYAAIAVVGKDGKGEQNDPPGPALTDAQKKELLALARGTVEAQVRGTPLPPLPADPALKKDGAAFVTLKKRGQLRGCIGQIIATGPLDRTVQEMAVSAASRDPRFRPVQPEELRDIDVEVSVLTPPTELKDPLAVRVGTDGLIIEKGYHRGVLLPQVPTEQGWTKRQYLDGIAEKAGLPPGAWRDAKLMRFQAIVFGERSGHPD